MRRFVDKFGWMFLVAGILIGVASARTVVDVAVTLVFVVLLSWWVIMWRRRSRTAKKV